MDEDDLLEFQCTEDAAFDGGTYAVGYGFCLHSRDDQWVAAVSGPLAGVIDAHMMEALTCNEALSWFKDNGYSRVLFQTDCQILSRNMSRGVKSTNHIAHTLIAAVGS
nr:protein DETOXIFICATION 29-like [Ipomoea batatas]